MSQHKLNLSEEIKSARRSAWNAIKQMTLPPDGLYLAIGNSNIGRNLAKRMVK